MRMAAGVPAGPWVRRFGLVRMAGLFIAAAALPWNNVLLSNAQILMVLGWLGEGLASGDLGRRFRQAFTDRWSLAFIAPFLLHAAGILWSEDRAWAMDLTRILLPVLVFGVVLSTSPPMGGRAIRDVLRTGAWSVVASTVVCLIVAGGHLQSGDHRAVSIFISHVRLGLLLALAACVFILDRPAQRWMRAMHVAAALWAVGFLMGIGSLSGLGALSAALVALAWRRVDGARPLVRRPVRVLLVLLPTAALLAMLGLLWPRPQPTLHLQDLEVRSAGGEPYYHDVADPQWENGNPVWVYVAKEELERGWARRSRLGLYGKDERGQLLRGTLVRYLASMGLRKDSVALLALSDEDVRRIEQGLPNVRTGRRPLLVARVEQLRMELDRFRATGDPNGHSLTMRLVYWRTGWRIAHGHLWTGVGTGDTRPAFAQAYDEVRSPLDRAWRNRAHNEYLTLLITFGLPGLLFILACWTAPVVAYRAWRHPVFIAWSAIFLVSCLTEDTLETQTGATFFALYAALFVFGGRWLNAQAGLQAAPPRVPERSV
ncbi:MAG: O-antigen ligase family protein [Flavobacteriales bacterium]|nr:O-antigen ligase family protein [Flavobacteriales bacterium]